MTTIVLIPARHAASRYPGKPLAALHGATGEARSLIRRSWERAAAVPGVDTVYVATDSAEIADHCRAAGAGVVMTDPACANGTERCAEALAQLSASPDVVVNFQGDAPLTPPHVVTAALQALTHDPDASVATPVVPCGPAMLDALRETRAQGRVGETTAVLSATGRALYFSKEILPVQRGDRAMPATPIRQHLGIYAYRPNALSAYPGWGQGPLEAHEGLEQLRFLENDRVVRCCEVDVHGMPMHELNNPEDAPRIEAVLAEQGIV